MFLDEYNKNNGVVFEVKQWPEQIERNKPAVEAIAVNERGELLAIEHTLLQGFVGEKEDSNRFLKVVGSLENDSSLRLPNYMIDITMRVGAIPKGVNVSSRDGVGGMAQSECEGFAVGNVICRHPQSSDGTRNRNSQDGAAG
jgi:hypothetical protein